LHFSDEHYSKEFQLHCDSDRLRGIVGAFYFNEEMEGINRAGPNPTVAPMENLVNFAGTVDVEAWALFTEFEYDLTPALTVKVSGRYSGEDRRAMTLPRDRSSPPGIYYWRLTSRKRK
jgi:hypothetical protein